jgi:HAD superfamily hydrolase (TIGR01484 family)
MRSLVALGESLGRRPRVLLTDIDDTLTTQGRLTAPAYQAMERLAQAGVAVVPVTGRPAGWCDHIARMWPVAAVVGENGAFYFHYERASRSMRRRFVTGEEQRVAERERLRRLAARILEQVPGTALASDQPYRESDLAVDYREDVAPLGPEAVDRIVALFRADGATARVSSIHVNGWYGDHDKLTTTRLVLSEVLGVDPQAEPGACVFVGDSPNDEPMFARFEHSVGVANVRDFADRLRSPPRYVTAARSGAGFCELAAVLLGLP